MSQTLRPNHNHPSLPSIYLHKPLPKHPSLHHHSLLSPNLPPPPVQSPFTHPRRDFTTFFPWAHDPHFSAIPGSLPSTPKPINPPFTLPPQTQSPDLDAKFTAFLAKTFDKAAPLASSPVPYATIPDPTSEPTAQPFDQPSTSTPHPISKASAAMYLTPIPTQLESKMDRVVQLLERISNQLSELSASQKDGFRDLSFMHDTLDVNAHNTGLETTGAFTFHTRRLMNEVSRCFASGSPHLPSVELLEEYSSGTINSNRAKPKSRSSRWSVDEALLTDVYPR